MIADKSIKLVPIHIVICVHTFHTFIRGLLASATTEAAALPSVAAFPTLIERHRYDRIDR